MTSIDAIINRQLLKWELEKKRTEETKQAKFIPSPIITISRQTGSRGSYFGSRLAQKLDYQRLHRDVIDAISVESGYFHKIVESLDNHARSNLSLMVESMITGKSFDHSDYIKHLCKVVLSLSELGGVILMGRGGNFILGPTRGFHIRFVCPVEERVNNLVKFKGITKKEAQKIIDRSDVERTTFIMKVFKSDIDDPRNYDLVINSALMDVEDIVEVAVMALKAKMSRLSHMDEED
jgi:cytidylate kinase